jgi:hypothetical protein
MTKLGYFLPNGTTIANFIIVINTIVIIGSHKPYHETMTWLSWCG